MEAKIRTELLGRVLRGVLVGLLIALALALGWPASAAWAQSVYKTPGAPGQAPVFSDKPQPGAREVTLPPLNIIDSPEPTALPVPRAPEGQAGAQGSSAGDVMPAYRSFAIVSPEDNGSVVANTAIFEVRVAVDPALQIGAGHAFTVSLNGQPVRQRFTANEFMIPPEFWNDTLPPPNQRMQLDAAIVDRDGRVLRQAAPVSFYMRHASRLQNPVPKPVPLPNVRPRASPGSAATEVPQQTPSLQQGALGLKPDGSMQEPAPGKAPVVRGAH